MSKWTCEKPTMEALLSEIGEMPSDYAVLFITNTETGSITIYIAPDEQVFRDKLKATRDQGEFGNFLEDVENALGE